MIAGLDDAFTSPGWLWLLLPAAVLTAWDLMRSRAHGRVRRLGAATVRLFIVAALIGALADPWWPEGGRAGHVIVVVDRSASIPDAALHEAMTRASALGQGVGDQVEVGLVMFDGAPDVAVFPGDPWTVPEPLRGRPIEATDIDAALRLAMGLIPADDAGAVVLLSDGRSTAQVQGASDTIAAEAEARGITIHTLPIDPARDDVALMAVELTEASVRPGATARGRIEIDGARQESSGVLVVRVGETEALRQRVDVPAAGRIDVPFSHEIDVRADPGTLPITAELHVDDEDEADAEASDTASTTLVVGDPPQVRIFAGETHDARALARALRAERMDVRVVQMDDLKPEDEDLSEVDLVVLANAPATSLGGGRALAPGFLDALVRFVDAGGGLLVLGGPQAYDLGGYASSPLARVLPVKLDPNEAEVQAAATMLVILDRSGSMSALVGYSKSKMQLADEGAVASIRLLRPFDRIGVMSVTEIVRWDVPIQPVRDLEAIERKVLRIRADGGGIFVYTALEDAYAALRKVDTPLRHIILFSDAADSEEKVKGVPFGTGPGPTSEALARKMRAENITTSVIGIGSDHDIDTPFLKDLARAGGGRFYLTDDATKLRSLFVEETERIVDSSLHQVVFRPVREQAHPIVEGIDYGSGPTLGGFQELRARPTAEVVLVGPEGHPLLTTWRYGLGQVVAWSSDAGNRWASRWLRWDGYTRQWTQAARFALRTRAGDATALEVEFAGGVAHLRVARRDIHGLSLPESGLRARVREGDREREVALGSDEPGLWQGRLPVEPGKSHTVEVVDGAGEVLATHTFAPPPSAERRHRSADVGYLRTLADRTGGTFDPATITPPAVVAATTKVHRLWPLLLVLALLLMPLDAALRRPLRVI